jgi:hypothetical protein
MVHTLLGAFVSILLLIVMSWITIFGGIGALLSRSRGGTIPAGLAWGSGLGPFGWVAIYLTTRTSPLVPSERPLPVSYFSEPPAAPPAAERWNPWKK